MKRRLLISLLALFCLNLFTTVAYPAVSVTNGVYNIVTALDNNKVLDVWGAGHNNGTNIQIYQNNDSLNQQFAFTRVTGKSGIWYKIIDQNSQKALDVAGGVSRSGVNVQLYDYNGSDAQLWQLESAGYGGYYYIKNKLGFYLNVEGAKTRNETNVQVYYKNWTTAQRFKLNPTKPYTMISENTYVIKSALNLNRAVDVYGGYTNNGTNIQLWEVNGTNAQKFTISLVGNGYYKIANVISGKVLDVAGGIKRSGVNVQLYSYNGSDAQLWRFYKNGSYYAIKNKLGYFLDVYGGYTNSGANIQVYTENGSKAQQFRLVATANSPKTTKYYVTTKVGLNLRQTPSSSGKIILTMPYRSELEVSSISNGWASCVYNGNKGYCSSAYISTTQPDADPNSNSNTSYAQPISVYGAKWMDNTGEGYMHDIMCAAGTPVYAIADGIITCSQIIGNNNDSRKVWVKELRRYVAHKEYYGKLVSYGNIIYFTSNDRKTTARYAHLSRFAKCNTKYTQSFGYGSSYTYVGGTKSENVGRNIAVKRGELIGYVGTTGNSSGDHLHFEIWINGKRCKPETQVNIN